MRRMEFNENDTEVMRAVLDAARIGHVASTDEEGLPVVLPFNFVRAGNQVVLHGSPRGFLNKRVGRPVSFLAYDHVTWIPSTWRHPELACPATTYYRSVLVRATLETVSCLERKAQFLQRFMERYQPEGGYRPLQADSSLYKGPLQALAVMSLDLTRFSCKVKMGQHLSPRQRNGVIRGLARRDAPGDRELLEFVQQYAGSA